MIATVAWLYHTRGLRQGDIADRLHVSQSRVSRLLDQAVNLGIVRRQVVLPKVEQSTVEQELQSAFDLTEVHVHELGEVGDEPQLVRELGQLLALHLQNASLDARVIGFTSWSRALAETVRNLQPLGQSNAEHVVEMVGDPRPPTLQHLAAENTQHLATLIGAEPMFLRLPGVLPNRAVKQALLDHNSHARAALTKLDALDLAMTGIGTVGIVPPLQAGDNFFTTKQIAPGQKVGRRRRTESALYRRRRRAGEPRHRRTCRRRHTRPTAPRPPPTRGGRRPVQIPCDQGGPDRRVAQHARHGLQHRPLVTRPSELTG
jgi:DNA-binding transcriptional regulator LsrR (DeoR family)